MFRGGEMVGGDSPVPVGLQEGKVKRGHPQQVPCPLECPQGGVAVPHHRCFRVEVVAPGALGTAHCGHHCWGHLTVAWDTSSWPRALVRPQCGPHPGDPPGTCHHLQGHLMVATALGSPHCSHQPQGHVTVKCHLSMATSSRDVSPLWPPALGTPGHCADQLLGHSTTNVSAWGHCTMALSLLWGHLSAGATSRAPGDIPELLPQFTRAEIWGWEVKKTGRVPGFGFFFQCLLKTKTKNRLRGGWGHVFFSIFFFSFSFLKKTVLAEGGVGGPYLPGGGPPPLSSAKVPPKQPRVWGGGV